MAKKNKKFKKKVSQNLSARIAEIDAIKAPAAVTPASNQPVANTQTPVQVVDPSMQDKYAYVRRDVRRNLIIIFILLVILTGVTILNAKTDYLHQLANWFYTTLNLKV